MAESELLQLNESGFYCPAGDFYIDPWQPVSRAVVTHAHTDHLARGCRAYLVAEPGVRLARLRAGEQGLVTGIPYGQTVELNGLHVSLHPAGHILGSAQVRVEHRGEVVVVSGDYKTDPDPTCTPFELVRCHTFITEATFGLPVFRWPAPKEIFDAIHSWWQRNQRAGQASLLYAYALGKAQRILAGLDLSIGTVYTHGAVERLNQEYRQSGVPLPATLPSTQTQGKDWSQALILAPPSARGTPWLRRFGVQSSAFASGWMRVRGMRRQRAIDQGFVISDHADWPAIMSVIQATGAEHIGVTHGYVPVVVRWLREQGYDAVGYATRYSEVEEGSAEEA
jgi:putative mRNA 3-end processing factor